MCWISRNELTKLIADKDIECYKNFRFEDITFKQKSIFNFKISKKKITQLLSLFERYSYIPYKKQRIINLKPIKIDYNPYNVKDRNIYYRIDTGYHSYNTIESAKETIFYRNELIIVKCIIPKDTEYYINEEYEIVSSTIIVTDKIVYCKN